MQHKYIRNYDYSDTTSAIKISMDKKLKFKEYTESLCHEETGFVSMRTIMDLFLDGDRSAFENYLAWLKDHK